MNEDQQHERQIVATILLAARLTNKPLGPSEADLVKEAVRLTDLLLAEVKK
jgi:hypothetical protein